MKKGRSESEYKEIEHDTEVKISDSILKVLFIIHFDLIFFNKIEIFNND